MKTVFAIIALFAIAGVRSQTTPMDDSIESQLMQELRKEPANQNILAIQPQKANETKIDGLTCDGILVQLMKTDNPLELINPAAPPEYGSSEDNVARDPITGKITGLKLFSIQF